MNMNETEAEMLLTNQINMSQGNDFTVLFDSWLFSYISCTMWN